MKSRCWISWSWSYRWLWDTRHGCWEPNPGPPIEQQVLLAIGLWPYQRYLLKYFTGKYVSQHKRQLSIASRGFELFPNILPLQPERFLSAFLTAQTQTLQSCSSQGSIAVKKHNTASLGREGSVWLTRPCHSPSSKEDRAETQIGLEPGDRS